MVDHDWRHAVIDAEVGLFRTPLWEKYDLDIQYTDEDFRGQTAPWKKLFIVSKCHDLVCNYLELHPEVVFRSDGAKYYDILLLASVELFDMIGEQ